MYMRILSSIITLELTYVVTLNGKMEVFENFSDIVQYLYEMKV